ncbi:hypothetical protein [Nonomuraea recticatena]|uniref:Uncharacterized protein n=1 Tax=Nonomuraea recticatena TaxID=46178 RepID=A0ABN3RPM3_9ACTN
MAILAKLATPAQAVHIQLGRVIHPEASYRSSDGYVAHRAPGDSATYWLFWPGHDRPTCHATLADAEEAVTQGRRRAG